MNHLIAAMMFFYSSLSIANLLTTEQKLDEFKILVNQIKSTYAPLDYKQDKLGLNIYDLEQNYIERIKKTKTNGQYYYSIVEFVAEFQDGHFSASVPSQQVSLLPVITNLVQGKVLIETVLTQFLSTPFPFVRGDEIVAINGKSAIDTVKELQKYVASSNELSRLSDATTLLTIRPASTMPTPKGSATVTVKSKLTGLEMDLDLNWIELGSSLDERDDSVADPSNIENESFATQSLVNPMKNLDMLSAKDALTKNLGPMAEYSYRCSGETRVKIPFGATIIMDEPFVAYYHPTVRGNIGYLRIPHYYPQNADGSPAFELRLAQYKYAVKKLEENTVGLVIDQAHNCGGGVSYMHEILSLFMNDDFLPLQFSLRASKFEYLQYSSYLEQMPSTILDYENVKRVQLLLEEAWNNGSFMTALTSISGEELWPRNSVNYTKPIVVLIDEFSGSGGDAFPAIIQGLGRAKLFGKTTIGMGGHVERLSPLPYSAISVRMTKSLFYRPDGVAVENNGAVPDREYEITEDDFVNGYLGYRESYLNYLFEEL